MAKISNEETTMLNNQEVKENTTMQYNSLNSMGAETPCVGYKTYRYEPLSDGTPINYPPPMNMVAQEFPQSAAGTLYHYDARQGDATLLLSLNLNVTELLQIQAQSMVAAYNLGVSQATNFAQQSSVDTITLDGYLGIYDDEAYGIYDSMERYNKSEIYWHKGSMSKQKFLNYDEAIEFAKAGVSALSGVPITDIPPLKVMCNWRQKIIEKSDEI